MGIISDDDSSKYVDEINKYTTYYKTNFLELNAKKTKEMIIDLGKSKALPNPIIINDHTVEHVSTLPNRCRPLRGWKTRPEKERRGRPNRHHSIPAPRERGLIQPFFR